MANRPENRESMFVGEREASYFNSIQTEYIDNVAQQSLLYFALDTKYTKAHKLYGEALRGEKIFRQPIKVYGVIKLEEPEITTTRNGIDRKQSGNISFQREHILKDLQFIPRIGDIVRYDNQNWEIIFVDDTFGKLASQPLFKYTVTVKIVLARDSQLKIINQPFIDDINRGGDGTTKSLFSALGINDIKATYPLISTFSSGLFNISLSSSYINGMAYDERFVAKSTILNGDVVGSITGTNSVTAIRGITTLSANPVNGETLVYNGQQLVASAISINASVVGIIAEHGLTSVTASNGVVSIGLSGSYYAKSFVFNQMSASSTWNINHNLNSQYVSVRLFTDNTMILFADQVKIVNNNTVSVQVNPAISGTALIFGLAA